MGRQSNEGKACDAVIHVLERGLRKQRGKIRHPEKEPGEPPVELRVPIGGRQYALEHTLIEPFTNEIKQYFNVLKPIANHLKKHLPEGLPGLESYQLHVPVDAELPSGKARAEALENLVNWILETEQRMRKKSLEAHEIGQSPYRADRQVWQRPPLLDFEVGLWRWPHASAMRKPPGDLEIRRSCPADLEQRRGKRLQAAFRDKCPKLEQCRVAWRRLTVRTVLVLESDDIALTSVELVAEHVKTIVTQRNDAPDEIFLVESESDPWRVWPLKQDQDHWPETGRGLTLFSKDELADVTWCRQ